MKITIRTAKNSRERLYAALNSTVNDLYPCNGRVIITGKNKEGEIINLGDVDEGTLLQEDDPAGFIDFVRFGRR